MRIVPVTAPPLPPSAAVRRLWALWAVLLSAFACACERREAPSDLRVELPDIVDSRDPVTVAIHATNAQGAVSSATDGADFSVEPQDLAQVRAPGLLTCERSGDGKLTVSLVGVRRTVVVRCRLVARIEAANVGRVELTAGPFKPKVRVLDKAGNELTDVELSYISKNSGVVYAKDGLLVPKLVGTANLTARAGQAASDFTVDVVRKVVVEALPIESNHKIYFSLEPGKYELTVKLPTEKHLSVEWRGAPYCNGSSEGRDHVATCGLRAKGGGVVFDNPAYLVSGAKEISTAGVELFEVP